MKVINIILCLIIASNFCLAQTKSVSITTFESDNISGEYKKRINLDNGDSSIYISFAFQNAKYKSITDTKIVIIRDSLQFATLKKDLKNARNEIGKKTSINWRRDAYQLDVYDFNDAVYFAEKPTKGDGHTILKTKEVDKLIEWLETIDFGKEKLIKK